MSKETTINGKKYTVEYVFKAVGNYYFTDEDGKQYLVDAEDVAIWADEENIKQGGIDTAIAYAENLATEHPDGIFWWTIKE